MQRLGAFARLAQELALATTHDEVGHLVATHAGPCVDADFSNLAFFDPITRSLHMFHGPRLDGTMAARYRTVPLAAPFPIAAAARDKSPVLLGSLDEYRARFPDLLADTERSGFAATGSLPLCRADDGSLLGAIGFAWRDDVRFDAPLEESLRGVAHLVAGTLERAVLYGAEHELIIALQGRLVGELGEFDGLVTASRYLPASRTLSVGGDWYEAIEREDDVVTFVVGDVAGHGAVAAADMALVRGVLSALVRMPMSVGDVLRHASGILSQRDNSLLVSAALVEVDLRKQRLTYATAGHPPPLLRLADGSVLPLDDANAPMMGVYGERAGSTASMPFPEGSRLVMYTDGLVERRDRPFEQGVVQLAHLLARSGAMDPSTFLDQAVEVVLGQPDKAPDDVAIMVVDRERRTAVAGRGLGDRSDLTA
jgi:hypothetical protein